MSRSRPLLALAGILAAASATAAEPAGDRLSLNFRDAEALAVVEFFARVAGRPFVPQDELKFTLSVISPGPVTRKTALDLFDTALALKGYSLVDRGDFIAVVRRQEATAGVLPRLADATPDERFVSHVIPLSTLTPARAAEAARPLLSPAGRAYPSGEALAVVDTAGNVRAVAAQLQRLDGPGRGARTEVHRLLYADVNKVAPILQQVFASELTGQQGHPAPLQIVPLPETQQVVVVGPESAQKRVADLIAQLDLRTRQVLIEVTLVDLTLEASTELGLEWQFHNGKSTAAQDMGRVGTDTLLQGVGGLKYTFLDQNRLRVLVNALGSEHKTEILANPRMVVADGKEANLHVGEEIPVLRELRLDQNNNPIKTFDQKKVGLTTAITPRIAANRDVLLTIRQDASELLYQNPQDLSYRIGERNANTQVMLKDGHTLVIGGLIKKTSKRTSSGTPWLSTIPGLGWLFGSATDNPSRSELLIIITPRVMENAAEADRTTQDRIEDWRDAIDISGQEFRL